VPTAWPPENEPLTFADPKNKLTFQEVPTVMSTTTGCFTHQFPTIVSNAGAYHAGVAPELPDVRRIVFHLEFGQEDQLRSLLDDGAQGMIPRRPSLFEHLSTTLPQAVWFDQGLDALLARKALAQIRKHVPELADYYDSDAADMSSAPDESTVTAGRARGASKRSATSLGTTQDIAQDSPGRKRLKDELKKLQEALNTEIQVESLWTDKITGLLAHREHSKRAILEYRERQRSKNAELEALDKAEKRATKKKI
jgi:hypothetical protein